MFSILILLCVVSKSIEAQEVKVTTVSLQLFDSLTNNDTCFAFYSENLRWNFAISSPFFTKKNINHLCSIRCDSLMDTILLPVNILFRVILKDDEPYVIYDSLWVSDISICQEMAHIKDVLNGFLLSLSYISPNKPKIISKREQMFFPVFAIPLKKQEAED